MRIEIVISITQSKGMNNTIRGGGNGGLKEKITLNSFVYHQEQLGSLQPNAKNHRQKHPKDLREF